MYNSSWQLLGRQMLSGERTQQLVFHRQPMKLALANERMLQEAVCRKLVAWTSAQHVDYRQLSESRRDKKVQGSHSVRKYAPAK